MFHLPQRLARFSAPSAAILATVAAAPASAHETGMPHLIHEHEGWVALAVVLLSLVGAALLVRRALRR
ncbi:hypothetical protein ACSUZJ_11665 [Telluria sp. B2]